MDQYQLRKYLARVKEMRDLQKHYTNYPTLKTFKKLKGLEALVDSLTEVNIEYHAN